MADEPELAEGAEGEWVEYLQQLLSSLGFYQGQIDGQFGPATTEAVGALQQQYSIDENGTVGAGTWQVITSAGTADGSNAAWDQTYDDQTGQDGAQDGQAGGAEAGATDADVDKTPKAERFLNDEVDDPETDEAEAPELDADEADSLESA